MESSKLLETEPSPSISSSVEISEDETRNAAVVSPMNSPPTSPNSEKTTISSTLDLDAEQLVKSIEDIQSEFSNDVKRKLPDGFKPTPYSVICGRGKECFESEGNKRFREIINSMLEEYTEAHGKSEKSKLVTRAMDIIREKSPQGAFVKREKGQWYEVSPRYAREKVGAWFRDCLSHRYKSSSKAKHAKKMSKRISYAHVNAMIPSGVVMVDPRAVFNFPPDFAAQLEAHEQRTVKSRAHASLGSGGTSLTSNNQAFYDIDDLSLIPFDSVDDF